MPERPIRPRFFRLGVPPPKREVRGATRHVGEREEFSRDDLALWLRRARRLGWPIQFVERRGGPFQGYVIGHITAWWLMRGIEPEAYERWREAERGKIIASLAPTTNTLH